MSEEEKIKAKGQVNTEQQEVEKSTKEIIEEEIEQFKRYLDTYIPGIDPEVVDEYLEHEDYVKMIITGLYNQYVALMVQQQQQQQQTPTQQQEGSQRL